MYSVLLLAVAAVGLATGLAALGTWRRTRSVILLFNLLVLAAAVLHASLGGLGHWLGPGTRLRDLYALPLLLATFALPASLFTFATISRGSGFAWAKIDWGHGAVCILAVVLLAYGLPGLLTMKAIAPACWRDVVWYLPSVPPPLLCPGAPPELIVAPRLPLVPMVVVAAYLGLGAGLLLRKGWAAPLLAMVIGAGLLLLPLTWGPVPRFAGEMACAIAMASAARRHAASQGGPQAVA